MKCRIMMTIRHFNGAALPMFGAAMAFSGVFAVTNSLRLRGKPIVT